MITESIKKLAEDISTYYGITYAQALGELGIAEDGTLINLGKLEDMQALCNGIKD